MPSYSFLSAGAYSALKRPFYPNDIILEYVYELCYNRQKKAVIELAKIKHLICLSDEDRAHLEEIIRTTPERTAMRAKILLASDFNNPKYLSVQEIADTLGVSPTTITVVRSEYSKLGIDGAVFPKGTLAYDRRALMNEEKRREILEMIKGRPPFGQRRWTIRNICSECVNRGIFDTIAMSAIVKLLAEENIDLKNPGNL